MRLPGTLRAGRHLEANSSWWQILRESSPPIPPECMAPLSSCQFGLDGQQKRDEQL